MHYRELGKTGVKVSEIGMGCNRLGGESMTPEGWVALVSYALDLGVTVFDTAPSYGWGKSEETLGQAIGNRGDVLIASKVSRDRESGEKDFSPERMLASVEASLQRLQRDCIDILQLHSPSLEDLETYAWAEAMDRLKAQGKIRFAGVSINDAASGRWLLERGLVQELQVAYNMIDPQVGQEVFPLAQAQGVGILVRMPMARGILTGKFAPGQEVDAGHRAALMGERVPDMVEKAEDFRPLAEEAGITMGQWALRYSITPAAVSAAIPGARTRQQLEQNVAASNGMGLTPEELAAVEAVRRRWR